jgi:hypothetical protein
MLMCGMYTIIITPVHIHIGLYSYFLQKKIGPKYGKYPFTLGTLLKVLATPSVGPQKFFTLWFVCGMMLAPSVFANKVDSGIFYFFDYLPHHGPLTPLHCPPLQHCSPHQCLALYLRKLQHVRSPRRCLLQHPNAHVQWHWAVFASK